VNQNEVSSLTIKCFRNGLIHAKEQCYKCKHCGANSEEATIYSDDVKQRALKILTEWHGIAKALLSASQIHHTYALDSGTPVAAGCAESEEI